MDEKRSGHIVGPGTVRVSKQRACREQKVRMGATGAGAQAGAHATAGLCGHIQCGWWLDGRALPHTLLHTILHQGARLLRQSALGAAAPQQKVLGE